MSYQPTPADIEIVERAAQSIDEEALLLRISHTKPPAHSEWGEDLGAQEAYGELKLQVGALYSLADRMRGTPPGKML